MVLMTCPFLFGPEAFVIDLYIVYSFLSLVLMGLQPLRCLCSKTTSSILMKFTHLVTRAT